MTDGYGQPPQQQQGGVPATQQQQGYVDDGYDYYGNTFRGMGPTDQAAQVRKALFELQLPETEEEFSQWIPMLLSVIEAAARMPGIDAHIVNELNLRMELIVDRAHSQGSKKQVASKLEKLLFRLRLYVSEGDIPLTGLTGILAMTTTVQKQEQTIRMPQQNPQTTNSIWPWGKK